MIQVYGIPNCDTVKKARAWLAEQGFAHEFHDFKKTGVSADQLRTWAAALGWDKLLNRQGTTWRKLTTAQQASAADPAGALALLQAQPSLIKRPVVAWPSGQLSLGFKAEDWASRAAQS